jgi:signal peptidase I
MVAFAVRPFIFEAYAQSTNSMAPTVLGDHWTGSCPECGARTYCTAESEGHAMEGEPLMICEHELRAYNVAPNSRQVTSADRFFVSKLLKPARWDLVTYRYPADPSTIYLGRLVGLPGDTLTIDDGSVWINGDRLIPPEEFSGLYHLNKLDDIPGLSIQMWGVPNQPAELGADEYFVLGDFSARSRDSRLWTESIDGRPPYALPAANIVGVLTHIYWPLDRLRVFR